MTYEEKEAIANEYLKKYEVTWDELSDINSLHDAETIEDIYELCDDRLREDMYPIDEDEE